MALGSASLLEDTDIARHIQQGAFVPLNIHADGSFQCAIRVGTAATPASLSERERRYLTVSSEPFLFRSRDRIAISGLEHIGRSPGEAASFISLASGDWAVTIHLVDWTEEPGAKTPDGKPTATALADFVVLLNPAAADTHFRTKVDTYERPGNA